MKICAIIPSHNHSQKLVNIVGRLQDAGLGVFIIDDGSDEPTRSVIEALGHQKDSITTCRFETNQGKGAAVLEGFRLALKQGYTHALQIDADGQHDLDALPHFLDLAKAHPEALISGQARYDASAPRVRKAARWITHVWVWIETLSFRIKDSMCGFRLYPLRAVKTLMDEESIGHHMDFDTDIMVRLFWRGVPPIMIPVDVIYPPDNTSNFKPWHDNWRISVAHTRLVLTMMARLPSILKNRPPLLAATKHWANLAERGCVWGLRFCVGAYKLLGRRGCQIVLAPIVLYFYFFGAQQRHASKQFLGKALQRQPLFTDIYHHHMNFAMRALDVLIAWTGAMPAELVEPTNPKELSDIVRDPRGGLIVVAHLGNVDVARAVLDKKTRDRLTILVHTHHAANYNRMIQQCCPEAGLHLIQVTEMGPETIIDLKQRVERGEWIVIAGDRISVLSQNNSLCVPFFGAKARFPQGPWVLGALLECPVYLLFCLQDGKRYHLTMERFAETLELPRRRREQSLYSYAERYVRRLEYFTALDPFQWYNFFDFWAN